MAHNKNSFNRNRVAVLAVSLLLVCSISLLSGCDLLFGDAQSPLGETTEVASMPTAQATEPLSGTTAMASSIPGESGFPATQTTAIVSNPEDSSDPILSKAPLPAGLDMTTDRQAALDYLDGLVTTDFGGLSVMITTTDISVINPDPTQSTDENAGATVINTDDLARVWRNQAVAAKYNVSLSYNYITPDQLLTAAQKAYHSLDYFGDFIVATTYQISQLAYSGLLFNLNKVPFLDTTAPYYNQNLIAGFNNSGVQYAVSGDALFEPDSLWGMFYNSSLIQKYNLTDPIDLVRSGAWDVDTMAAMARKATGDLNGDGMLTNDADRFGLGVGGTVLNYVDVFFQTGGCHLLSNNSAGTTVLTATNSYNMNVLDKIRLMYTSDNKYNLVSPLMGMGASYTPDVAASAFAGGRLLFYVAPLSQIQQLNTPGLNWNVVPVPKMTTSQPDYVTPVTSGVYAVCAPRQDQNTELTGKLVQAFFAASYKHIVDEYLTRMQLFYLQNAASVQMMSQIIGNAYGDLGYMFSITSSTIVNDALQPIYSYALSGTDITPTDQAKYQKDVATFLANMFSVGQ